jgi:hypothetical protein
MKEKKEFGLSKDSKFSFYDFFSGLNALVIILIYFNINFD